MIEGLIHAQTTQEQPITKPQRSAKYSSLECKNDTREFHNIQLNFDILKQSLKAETSLGCVLLSCFTTIFFS